MIQSESDRGFCLSVSWSRAIAAYRSIWWVPMTRGRAAAARARSFVVLRVASAAGGWAPIEITPGASARAALVPTLRVRITLRIALLLLGAESLPAGLSPQPG